MSLYNITSTVIPVKEDFRRRSPRAPPYSAWQFLHLNVTIFSMLWTTLRCFLWFTSQHTLQIRFSPSAERQIKDENEKILLCMHVIYKHYIIKHTHVIFFRYFEQNWRFRIFENLKWHYINPRGKFELSPQDTVKPGNKDPWKQRPLSYEDRTWSWQSLHISCWMTWKWRPPVNKDHIFWSQGWSSLPGFTVIAKGSLFKASSERLSPEIDILIRSPI